MQEARRSIKKRKNQKDKKAKKNYMKMRRQLPLVWGSAGTQGGGDLNYWAAKGVKKGPVLGQLKWCLQLAKRRGLGMMWVQLWLGHFEPAVIRGRPGWHYPLSLKVLVAPLGASWG